MLYVDRMFMGEESSEDSAVRVPDEVLKSVCFICAKTPERYFFGATGFFVIWGGIGQGRQTYLVTARHAVTAAKAKGDGRVYVCVNTKHGKPQYHAIREEWMSPDDETIDIAAVPFDVDPCRDDVTLISERNLVTVDRIARRNIGVGDDLWIAGLFKGVPGASENRPIIRTGTIAATPQERIAGTHGKDGTERPRYVAYLAELRSVGGLSGSPVWVHLPYGRGLGPDDPPPKPSREDEMRRDSGLGEPPDDAPNYLLGVIRLHFTTLDPYPKNRLANMTDYADAGVLNAGIAAVTPIQFLANLLNCEDVVSARKKTMQKNARRAGGYSEDDSAFDRPASTPGPEPERLKIKGDWTDAVRRGLKKKPPPTKKRRQ